MSVECKPPVWPWIAALLIAFPVLYVASFGPAVWLLTNDWISLEPLAIAYRPIFQGFAYCPPAIRSALIYCWTLGGASDIVLFFLFSPGQGAS